MKLKGGVRMKKIGVSILVGMLLCPLTLATAEETVNSSSTFEEYVTDISKNEGKISSGSLVTDLLESSESYTEVEKTTENSSEKESNKTDLEALTEAELFKYLDTLSGEELFEALDNLSEEILFRYLEELATKATTPEEYQRALEIIKKYTDYDQSQRDSQENESSIQGFSSRVAQKIGVAEFLGITKSQLLNELQRHEYDNFYLGTPFKGLMLPSRKVMSPNGAPNEYGPGFNCTGFVASAFERAGGDLTQITRRANAWGDVANAYNWRDALRPNTENYAFNSVNELLASGKAEKGDVIYFEPDYTKPGYDCHIGFFWGSRSNENLMWHSYDRNIKSNIKSATPFTKIYLFKLGNDKDAVQYDKKMNNERFIGTNNAAVYDSAYKTGSKKIDSTNGLYGQQVKVTRELKNGNGIWQEMTYKRNGVTKKGWVQSRELKDIAEQSKYSTKLALNHNKAAVYDKPYYPGVKRKQVLSNQKGLAMNISEKARTGYGEWYKVSYQIGNKTETGWVKTTDLAKIVNQREVNILMTVNKDYGSIFESPFTGYNETKKIGDTRDSYHQEIHISEEAYTGYGHWYKTKTTINNQEVDGWIKADDLGEYYNFKNLNSRMIANKHNGAVYDTPYVATSTKKIDDLNGLKDQIFNVEAVAETDRGTWYHTNYMKSNKKKSGWVKSTDLDQVVNQKSTNKTMTVKIAHGSIFDQPYIGPNDTNKLGTTEKIAFEEILVTEEARTGYGHWYKTKVMIDSQEVDGWIKVNDLGEYYNYEILDTRMFANKHNGAVYDSPYVATSTKKIDDLNGVKDQILTIKATAETDRGIWYQADYVKNNKKKVGWIKSSDLDQIRNQKSTSKKMTVKINYGSIFDRPYTGSKSTQKIGSTQDLEFETVVITEEAQTGYGYWSQTKLIIDDQEVTGWIKADDLGEYYNYKKLDTQLIANKDNGAVYDSPYVETITQKIDDLNGLKNHSLDVVAVAETDRGIWYEVNYQKKNSKKSGWVKSTDLDETISK